MAPTYLIHLSDEAGQFVARREVDAANELAAIDQARRLLDAMQPACAVADIRTDDGRRVGSGSIMRQSDKRSAQLRDHAGRMLQLASARAAAGEIQSCGKLTEVAAALEMKAQQEAMQQAAATPPRSRKLRLRAEELRAIAEGLRNGRRRPR